MADVLNALNRKLERYEAAGMTEAVEAVKAKIASLTDLSSLKKDELVALAEQKGIDTDGMTKAEVLKALEEG